MGVKKEGRNKVDVSTTLSPYIYSKMEDLVGLERFSSVSDLISIALTEFLVKFPDEDVKA